jgi:hypothetical protein
MRSNDKTAKKKRPVDNHYTSKNNMKKSSGVFKKINNDLNIEPQASNNSRL